MNAKSPLDYLPRLSESMQVELLVKRDDLFPMTGGGNKARKIIHLLREAEAQGCNALVTCGGLQSNHARVTALAAAARGWRCKLVLHGTEERATKSQGNLLLMQLAGADIEVVEPSSIAQAIQTAINTLVAEGATPYAIPGGGHSVLGAKAFVEAADEIWEQCQETGWQPEYIVLASGTGTTQAGLIVGLERLGWQTQVLGISVARRNPRGADVVERACRDLRQELGIATHSGNIDFRDGWVGEGYERANASVHAAIRMAAEMEGLILDPTYTGKAFAALLDLVRRGEIQHGACVLFWHTGGLLNLMASDYMIGNMVDQ